MPDITVTDPGVVNVESQAFNGFPTQVPPIGSTPASASATNLDGDDASPIRNQQADVRASSGQVTPASTSPNNADGDDPSQVKPVAQAANQPVTVGPAQTAGTNVNGGTYSPTSPNVLTTQQNTVVGQQYGTGVPRNVFVG